MNIRIVISGRSYDAASQLPDTLELPDGATVDQALDAIEQLLGGGATLPATALIAAAGQHLGTRAQHADAKLNDGDELVILTPVAGG